MARAMLLAAGRGERMRPLTDTKPKPLLRAGGIALLEYHIRALVAAGITDLVVNVAWQRSMLRDFLGDGSRFGARITISDEGDTALDTGGGVFRALPLLGSEPFWLVNGDVYIDYEFSQPALPAGTHAHLLLVPNPTHNPAGDFALSGAQVANTGSAMLTYSGVAVLSPELFTGCEDGIFSLVPLLREAADRGQLSGELHSGYWCDVGTPERLRALDDRLRAAPRLTATDAGSSDAPG
ncbi:MAG: nucleotidyltransferase family protein [Gammaproteobacteria bacterium]|nr:nucleotidyltransferase family protein [Gammaproteobacteria bacterium]NND53929.1 nucleotidyltransferase family protein [Gammaproteobacteria bacterium]